MFFDVPDDLGANLEVIFPVTGYRAHYTRVLSIRKLNLPIHFFFLEVYYSLDLIPAINKGHFSSYLESLFSVKFTCHEAFGHSEFDLLVCVEELNSDFTNVAGKRCVTSRACLE